MDRDFIARQLKVAIDQEPLMKEASDEYKAQMVVNWTHHLAGNWEQIERGQAQLAARKAAKEKVKV